MSHAVILDALTDVTVSSLSADTFAAELAAALEARGYELKKRRAPRATVAPPVFSTGDDALDAFMRNHWTPADAEAAQRRRSAGLPSKTHLKPRAMTTGQKEDLARFNEYAIAAWLRLGYEVRIERVEGRADNDSPTLDGRNVTILAPAVGR